MCVLCASVSYLRKIRPVRISLCDTTAPLLDPPCAGNTEATPCACNRPHLVPVIHKRQYNRRIEDLFDSVSIQVFEQGCVSTTTSKIN